MSERRERRRGVRLAADGTGTPFRLRFRAGGVVDVVDLSDAGALLETDRHVGPGATVEMVLSRGEGPVPVRVRVVHARVCALPAGSRARYRVGVAFLSADTIGTRGACVEATHRPPATPRVTPSYAAAASGPQTPAGLRRVLSERSLVRELERSAP